MSKRNILKNFVVMVDNVRGIKSKLNSIKDILEEEKPAILALTETKLVKEDVVEFEGYITWRVDRKEGKEGGGVLILFRDNLAHVMKVVREEKENMEMLWIKLDNSVTKARIGVVYMPQENSVTLGEIKEIYKKIETEIETAAESKEKIVLMGDFNCKVGSCIPGNSDEITKGGRVMKKLMEKHSLVMLNSEKVCEGVWTRIEGEEKSVIDYVIVNEEDKELYKEMKIDELKDLTPYSVDIVERKMRHVYTDHCMIKIVANLYVETRKKNETRRRLDKKNCELFSAELKKENVSNLINQENFKESYSKWCEKVMEIRDKYSNDTKRRKKTGKCERLLRKSKRGITKKLKTIGLDKDKIDMLKKRKELVMEYIDKEHMMENKRKIEATVQEVKEGGGVNSTTFWKVKDKLMRRTKQELAAIMDENGVKKEEAGEIKDVYSKYFMKLLETNKGSTEEEIKWEKVVQNTIQDMEGICQQTKPQVSKKDDIEYIVKGLKMKKAPDRDTWNNEMVVLGGDEMINSLHKIFQIVDVTMEIPDEWNKMAIRTLHKKGSKYLMENKRGLFLTSIISKVYERLVKYRNEVTMREKRSPWQMGGEKERSCTDNLFITYSVIERNRYMGKPTYVFYADAEKCFDKLWLDDAVIELWKRGTNIRDAMVIREMNKTAKIMIHTPVGDTDEIICENIVRQGTVYGPQLCGVSMGRVNDIGRGVTTMYGPNLVLQSTQFVDDVESAGSARVVNNTIHNCKIMEERKKMKFNNTNGKTEYIIVDPTKNPETITSEVKNGKVLRAKEHKYVGHWMDERGTYMINIEKNKTKVSTMIASVAAIGSMKMGTMAAEVRLNLVNVIVMKSLLYNIETIPQLAPKEIKELEKVQHHILTKLLNIPKSTPYCGILLETGMWTMDARIDYSKLMLYHNIKNSDDQRIIKQIVEVQEEEVRETTWISDIRRILLKYEVENDVKCLKSTWKKKVKEKIHEKVEKDVQEKCRNMKKVRVIKNDKLELKEYLKKCTLQEASDIMRMRLHMSKIPSNYGVDRNNCPLCGALEKAKTKHFFGEC